MNSTFFVVFVCVCVCVCVCVHTYSISGHVVIHDNASSMYTISKHAVTCMVECVRRELREKKSAIKITVSFFSF